MARVDLQKRPFRMTPLVSYHWQPGSFTGCGCWTLALRMTTGAILTPLRTAAGQLSASRVVTSKVRALNERITPCVLDDAPNLLSIGHRCRWEGYRFSWEPFSDAPTIETCEGQNVECVNIGNMPRLQENILECDATPL